MKKNILLILAVLSLSASAQNIQLHYDFGKQEDGSKHNFPVSTFELFKPDSLGYTFLFADFEFNSTDRPRGASLGYFEIARTFYIPWFSETRGLKNLMLHVEYNDGLVIYPDDGDVLPLAIWGANLRSSWLGGLEYGAMLGNLSLNAMLLYKNTRGSSAPDAQFTLVWFYPLFNYRVSLAGYVDIWSQDDFFSNTDNKILALYAEPQIWFNFNEHLSLGSEFKVSKNFVFASERVEVFPTLGVKYEF
ncbi:MAG: DUF5020 family protein [Bacteroidales bacterium]|nr:DUF5020 family protein [Bacteroidales bacterium]